MLAYLYCAAYTRMTMNESSPSCEQRRITFNDDVQRVQFARPELLGVTLHLHVQAATNCTTFHTDISAFTLLKGHLIATSVLVRNNFDDLFSFSDLTVRRHTYTLYGTQAIKPSGGKSTETV